MPERRLPNLTRRQLTGIGFIYLAGLGWLADIIIPFTSLPNKPTLFTVALGIAETSFIVGLILLGRDTYKRLKSAYITFLKNRGRTPDTKTGPEGPVEK